MSKGISWYPMLADRTMLLGGVCPFCRALISSRCHYHRAVYLFEESKHTPVFGCYCVAQVRHNVGDCVQKKLKTVKMVTFKHRAAERLEMEKYSQGFWRVP